ncbi:ATP-dependent endonuclease [Bacteroidota bacterium]
MKLLKTIDINNIKANSKAKLDGLNDFNIIIGPNNCGKTSILETVLSIQDIAGGVALRCTECRKLSNRLNATGFKLRFSADDIYLGGSNGQRKPYLRLSFHKESVKQLFEELDSKFSSIGMDHLQKPHAHLSGDLIFTGDTDLTLEHLSPFILDGGIEKLASSILYCPEGRLQTYKDQSIKDYIRGKNLSGNQLTDWTQFFRRIVDPKIDDYKQQDLDLIRKLEDSYVTQLADQGSGCRSVACIAIDILSSNNVSIVLIDEPELGLNPYSKQLLLQFLLEESKKKQVIITTHDPTFVNPILWKLSNVSIYLYSPYKNEYVKVDSVQSDTVPETFGGYLPHTNSLRDIHIYVEGPSDVYILQSFLRKYCRDKYKNWSEMMNRVGIFHLAGDFWCHLLYTLPNQPYKCIVILDGDKRKKAEEVCQSYAGCRVNMAEIKFAANINEVQAIINDGHCHPVYCLSKDCIELYLGLNGSDPPNYNKIIDGPNRAEDTPVPIEISDIFDAILAESTN